MKITLRTPTQAALNQALADASAAAPSLELSDRFEDFPAGFRLRTTREVVGSGAADYEHAKRLIKEWAFLPRWIHPHPDATPQHPGQTLLVVANTLGIRWLLPTRILQTINDPDGSQRGFVYSALHGHIAQGYERFVTEYDPATGNVTFDVTAVARPTTPFLRLIPPIFPFVQSSFRHGCMRQLRRAIRRATVVEPRP
jgi:uncharacterized protein (UPF0548 family)